MEKFEENVTFEEVLNQFMKKIKVGTTVIGTIVEINKKGEIFVDIGYKADGLIPRSEYSFDENQDPHDEFHIGDKIKADILKLNDGQGNVLMSYKKSKLKNVKEEFNNKVNNKEIFEEKVKDVNSNGMIVYYKGVIRIFIPLSLSQIGREENIDDYKNKLVKFKIIENDEKNRKIIGSIREIYEEERKIKSDAFWNEIEIGKQYKGTVNSISDYGAFVDVGGAQGLLHISEISWSRNANPREILQVGQAIDVKVKELDKENKRFKLSYEKKGPNPWDKIGKKYNVGDVVKVKITRIVPFGAFVEIEKGIEGLVHISQVCEQKINNVEEKLKIGEKVNAKIIAIDLEKQKIELSIRDLEGTTSEYSEE